MAQMRTNCIIYNPDQTKEIFTKEIPLRFNKILSNGNWECTVQLRKDFKSIILKAEKLFMALKVTKKDYIYIPERW